MQIVIAVCDEVRGTFVVHRERTHVVCDLAQVTRIALKRMNSYDGVMHHVSHVAVAHLLNIGDLEVRVKQLFRGEMLQVELHDVRDTVTVNTVMAVVHECCVRLEGVMQRELAVLVSTIVT